MQQLSKNIFVETGFRGSNVSFVVTKDGVVMIDTPAAPTQAILWRQEIAKWGPVCYIINTEHHVDHISGDFFFPGALVAHEGTRRALAHPSMPGVVLGWFKKEDPKGVLLAEGYQLRLPELTFSERLTLYLGDHTFELYHLPGHTASQVAVYVPQERAVFTGDNVVYQRQPYFFESNPFHWLESLKQIKEFDTDYIIPGHGEVCRDKGYVVEFSGFIQGWLDAVQKAINQGLSKEAVTSSISFLDRYPMNPGREAFGPELQRMNAGRIYDLLTRQK